VYDDPVGQAGREPREQCELPDLADAYLCLVACQAGKDCVHDGGGWDLGNVEFPHRLGVDNRWQHIGLLPSSPRRERASECTAAFVAAYTARPGTAVSATAEDMKTTAASGDVSSNGSASRVIRTVPPRLTSSSSTVV
jgi:hypothetical protein